MSKTDIDAVRLLLEAAEREGHLGPERIAALTEALAERARDILDRRVRELEVENSALKEKAAWAVGALSSVTEERAQLLKDMEALEAVRSQSVAAHDELLSHHRRTLSELALKTKDADALEALRSQSAIAHDRLLEHHNRTLADLATSLETIADSLGSRGAKTVRELSATLRGATNS